MIWTPLTRYTRAGRSGRVIRCPECGNHERVFHFSWSALACTHCHASVSKERWTTQTPPPFRKVQALLSSVLS